MFGYFGDIFGHVWDMCSYICWKFPDMFGTYCRTFPGQFLELFRAFFRKSRPPMGLSQGLHKNIHQETEGCIEMLSSGSFSLMSALLNFVGLSDGKLVPSDRSLATCPGLSGLCASLPYKEIAEIPVFPARRIRGRDIYIYIYITDTI